MYSLNKSRVRNLQARFSGLTEDKSFDHSFFEISIYYTIPLYVQTFLNSIKNCIKFKLYDSLYLI